MRYQEGLFSLDSLTLRPGSFQFTYKNDTTLRVLYDIQTNKIQFSTSFSDSILICYKVFPFHFTKPYYNRDLSRYDSVLSFDDMLIANLPSFRDEREEIFS
ncbi:MAG TPA: hypothetical protein DCM08_14330, partial [Microscillaceae bacterium]|nr:hypothetical protein [Microscillaceae bacterium]